jgi:hypothetical protein
LIFFPFSKSETMEPERHSKRLKTDASANPNAFDIHDEITKKRARVYSDEEGIQYGLLSDNNAIKRGFQSVGQVDDDKSYAMWVRLPKLVRSDSDTWSHFPSLGSDIELRNARTEEFFGSFNVSAYPSKGRPNARTTVVILTRN